MSGCAKLYKVVRMLSPIELKKLKKDYLTLSKMHPPKKGKGSGFEDSYLEFLNGRLSKEWIYNY